VLVGLPGVLDDGTLEGEGLVDFQGSNVLGHEAAGVGLDNELEVTGLFWGIVSRGTGLC
jgi:hypothetical protein